MPAATIPATGDLLRPGAGGPGAGDGSFGGDGDGGRRPSPRARQTHRLGIWLGLASVTMLFLGLTSAFIVREKLGGEWAEFAMPPLLVVNTLVLLASSAALERSKRALAGIVPSGARPAVSGVEVPPAYNTWLLAAVALGLLFLVGQAVAWQQLSARGIYLSTNPHSSFFYTLTGMHGLHLLGGLVALGYLTAWRGRLPLLALRRRTEATAIYWHFMDGLWVYLLLLLFVWK
ncbi:MAG: cytochrome c oxidase subunit 3 [Bryobacteraceae bacterium]|nr:cytochrome c oxidase subunit 3 [Bryobacteraceae bacterium]